mgnify:FL=1
MKKTLSYALRTAILSCGTTLLILVACPAAAGNWQEKLLFHPPESQRRVEQRGRIMIYERLKDTRSPGPWIPSSTGSNQ